MRERKSTKLTARVTPKTRRLVETAAEQAGETVSAFVAGAAERAARAEVAFGDGETSEDGQRPQVARRGRR